ncbi:hypothetical protein [Actinoplanes siamensis]|nr:hypothetical protein [Actinoplanes siamensis]
MSDAIDVLIERTGSDGRLERTNSGVLIHEWDGETFNPPLVLHVTADELATTIRDNAAEATVAWTSGGKPQEKYGWYMLITHLDEAITVRDETQNDLALGPAGIILL